MVAAVGEEAAGKRGGRVLLGGAAFDVDGAGAEEFVQGMRADKKTGTLGVVVEQCDGFWNESKQLVQHGQKRRGHVHKAAEYEQVKAGEALGEHRAVEVGIHGGKAFAAPAPAIRETL